LKRDQSSLFSMCEMYLNWRTAFYLRRISEMSSRSGMRISDEFTEYLSTC